MSNSSHPIPEPLLQEHQLLAEAAPEVELSAGFRSQVLAQCSASQAMAQKVFAAKVAAGVLTAALAGAAVYAMWNSEPEFDPQLMSPVSTGPDQPVQSISTGSLSTSTLESESETVQVPKAVELNQSKLRP